MTWKRVFFRKKILPRALSKCVSSFLNIFAVVFLNFFRRFFVCDFYRHVLTIFELWEMADKQNERRALKKWVGFLSLSLFENFMRFWYILSIFSTSSNLSLVFLASFFCTSHFRIIPRGFVIPFELFINVTAQWTKISRRSAQTQFTVCEN